MSLGQCVNRRLTGREAAGILLILGILGGLGYWAYRYVTARLLEARVHATLPAVCDEIRNQRAKLIAAIEAYKAHFGVYPPDHVLSRHPLVVDPATNTLLYELVGVIYNPTNKMFQVGGMEAAEASYVTNLLQCDGFKNCAESPDKITRFLKLDPVPNRLLHDDPDVFALSFQIPVQSASPELAWEYHSSPWRYISSAPTNNPGRFDLWMELQTRWQTVVIGNWKAVD